MDSFFNDLRPKDHHVLEKVLYVTERLMLTTAQYDVKAPLDSLLLSFFVTVSIISIRPKYETANTMHSTATLGTLALTSTNGRACTPRMRGT